MKSRTAITFLFTLLLASCTVVPTGRTATPSQTIAPTETITPIATETLTPLPPTATFTPTAIPTMEGGYPVVMQVAILNPYIEENWPGRGYSITKTIFNGTRYVFAGPRVHLIEKDEYVNVDGVGWSPSGKYFLFAASNTNNMTNSCMDICDGIDLWIISNDGTYKKLLTSESKLAYHETSWHLTETKLITLCPTGASPILGELEICIVQLPEGKIIHTGNIGHSVLYSPTDDMYMYSAQNAEGHNEFYTVYGDSSTPQKILTYEIYIAHVDTPDFFWSPDGKYFYSVLRNNSDRSALYRIRTDGTKDELAVLKNKNMVLEGISPNGSYFLLCDALSYPHQCDVFNANSAEIRSMPPAQYYLPFWMFNSRLSLDGTVFNFTDNSKEESPDIFSFEENNTIYYFDLYGLFISKLP